MRLSTWVVNLDTEPDRWVAMREHLARFDGLEVHRWPAIPAHSVTVTKPTGYQDRRHIAISRTYRRLLDYLGRDYGPWLILQDDITLTEHPARTLTRPLHLLGGYASPHRPLPPDVSPHVCPQAFIATRAALEPLIEALRVETVQVCVAWTSYLSSETVTWDDPPTSRHRSRAWEG